MSPRYLAVEALGRILDKGERPKDLLEDLDEGLDVRDRALLMELVYGVLRFRDYLDWLLSPFLSDPERLKPGTRNTLRIAVYQLRFLRVPDWAAVNEAVDTEKRKGGLSPLVNAVLRNYLRRKDSDAPALPDDPAGSIAITTSHPLWLVKRWIDRFGIGEARSLAESNNEPPPLTLRIDADREGVLELLRRAGIEAVPTPISPMGIIVKGIAAMLPDADGEIGLRRVAPRNLPLDSSTYVIQDEAAQLVTLLLNPQPGERVLDGCAAPGGKTTHMARLMDDRGEVVAVDSDHGRALRIRENCDRLGLRSVRIVEGDLRTLKIDGLFDRILIDAPCSSLGVIRRNPDVKYRHEESDLSRFRNLQLELVERATMFLKPGGSMVYSVCSTEPEEGEEVMADFLQRHRNFSMIEGNSVLFDGLRHACGEGVCYRTFPHRHATDGFFAARLERIG